MTTTKTLVSTGNCNYCDRELYEGQENVHDKEGSVSYCDEECTVSHIRKHAREYLEFLFEKDLFERVTQQK